MMGAGGRTFPKPPEYWVRPTGLGVGPKGAMVVAVKALLPYQKLFDSYEQALKDAIDYQPMRDQPRVISFVVERAEVPVGADPDDPRLLGLYQRFPADYRALAARSDAVCLVVRALETRGHVDAWKVEASSLDDDDLAF